MRWPAVVLTCLAIAACGTELVINPPGPKGDAGERGPEGPAGRDGLPGTSCTVEAIPGGSEIACSDGTVSQVYSGTQVTPIPLCPTKTGGLFTEYLLQVGSDFFAVYADGVHIGYTKLWAGHWATTDGRSCRFQLTADGRVVEE